MESISCLLPSITRVHFQADFQAVDVQELKHYSEKDEELKSVGKYLMNPKLWETDNSVRMYRPFIYEFSFHGEILLRGTRIAVPALRRNQFLILAQESHPGVERMKRLLRGRVWWPGMNNDTMEFVEKCTSCILVTKTNHCEPIKRRD